MACPALRTESLRTSFQTTQSTGHTVLCWLGLSVGWGDPVNWLRRAEDHFHQAEVPVVASLIGKTGQPDRQRLMEYAMGLTESA